ncbi:NAD(+) synthase, partial [Salmonella enterica]|nr:NAD(+) synthase [Salmonella enterica]
TLIQHLIRWVVSSAQFEGEVNDTLLEIVDQEISPELVPAAEGEKMQSTEDMVGPYPLQDFTLYHVLRWGFRPSKIAFLAMHGWADAESGEWPSGYPES